MSAREARAVAAHSLIRVPRECARRAKALAASRGEGLGKYVARVLAEAEVLAGAPEAVVETGTRPRVPVRVPVRAMRAQHGMGQWENRR